MTKIYDIKDLKVTAEAISFELLGTFIVVPLSECGSSVLPHAGHEDLLDYEIDGYGLGIHWRRLDEDLSIEGLLRTAGRKSLIVRHRLPDWYRQESPAVAASLDFEQAQLARKT